MAHRSMRRGFTTLEAVVALAIVGIVCVGVLGAHAAGLRADTVAVERLPLSALAVERLAALDLDPGSLERPADSLTAGAFVHPYAGVAWTIETSSVMNVPGLYEVVVRVRDGRDTFTLRTRRYRPQRTGAR